MEASAEHEREMAAANGDWSELPDDEHIDWPALWAAEVFGPSSTPALLDGLSALGLDQVDPNSGTDVAGWVRESRRSFGAWTRAGVIGRVGIGPTVLHGHEPPDAFRYIDLSFHALAPGVTVLTLQCVLQESQRRILEETIRRDYEARISPLPNGGHRVEAPQAEKARALGKVREQIRGQARSWITANLPGAFSSRVDADHPCWDLLVSEKGRIYDSTQGPSDWRTTLGFGFPVTRWRVAGTKLDLIQPAGWDNRDDQAAPSFVGRREQLFDMLGLGYGRDLESLVVWVDDIVQDHLPLAALLTLLDAHHGQFARIRDELAAPPRRGLFIGSRLKRLRNEVLPLSFDLSTLGDAAANSRALELAAMHSGVELKGKPTKWLNGSKTSPAAPTFVEALRRAAAAKSDSVVEQGRQVTDALSIQGELLLSTTNLRLQWGVAGLTLLVGVAGVWAALTAG